MKNNAIIFELLQRVAQIFPAPFYWLDLNQKYLGLNTLGLKVAGSNSYEKDFLDKTPYDLFPTEMAENIVTHHKEVIRIGKTLTIEESIKDITSGEVKLFNATIAPLRNDDGEIIGTIGFSLDITTEKKEAEFLKKAKIFEHLERVAQIFPVPIYWLDLNQKYLGVNTLTLKVTGTTSYENDFANKTPYDLYPKEMAAGIVAHHQKVIQTGETLAVEESIKDVSTNATKHFNATIAPLRDDDGKIIGTFGISIEVTAQKESERLKLENAAHKAQLEAQEKFTINANQVAHDIRSPLASLLMIVKSCQEIPEQYRIALREAAISISDISNNLLEQYQKHDSQLDTNTNGTIENSQAMLVSAVLLEVLTEKKYQYHNFPIKFDYDFKEAGYFAFIKIQLSAFRRMISNIINNAVDAFEGKAGKILLKLQADNEWVEISVIDDGKGIPEEVRRKILDNIVVTADKREGHGIGLAQVRETLQKHQGELNIESTVGQGTSMRLKFPRIKAPAWIAEKIQLNTDDLVIILDDDTSIHGAWDTHFAAVIKQYPTLKVQHFHHAKEALHCIRGLSQELHNNLFLLTDFELLNQELNGLNVVADGKVQRSILVTSHYANKQVLAEAAKTNTKILPKQLASEIPILVVNSSAQTSPMSKTVDVILLDDDIQFTNILKAVVFSGLNVDEYQDPHYFLKQILLYDKNTRIYLDYNYEQTLIKGMEIACQLYEMGFIRLYLLTGQPLIGEDIPDYLTVIPKDNIEAIQKSLVPLESLE